MLKCYGHHILISICGLDVVLTMFIIINNIVK